MNKLKLLLATIPLALLTSCCLFEPREPIQALAIGEEEETSIVEEESITEEEPLAEEISSEEVSVFESEVATEEVSEEANENFIVEEIGKVSAWIEERIVPIISGFSIANIIGILVSIVTAIAKVKGDKKNGLLINAQDLRIEDLQETVKKLTVENEQYSQFAKDLMEKFQSNLAKSTEIMGNVSEEAKAIADKIAEQSIHIEQVEKMKESLETACTLIAKTLALSETAVKSGLAEDAMKLIQNIEGANSDGKEN